MVAVRKKDNPELLLKCVHVLITTFFFFFFNIEHTFLRTDAEEDVFVITEEDFQR